MSLPFVWWANRKSKIGLSPIAKEPPPKSPGKPWWTDPPTTDVPQPEHIEYVAQYHARLLALPGSKERQSMMMHVGEWMRAAKQLLHIHMYTEIRPDMATTEGALIAADDALHVCITECNKHGIRLPQSVIDVNHALQRKVTPLRRVRAIEAAKRDNGVTVRKAVR